MKYISESILNQLYLPPKNSHKGQNGKLMIIGGSKLFHGASLWSLKVASRIVDMVYYASVKQNQKLTEYLTAKLYSFICVPEGKETEYITQADAILIGPGMVRGDKNYTGTGESGLKTKRIVSYYLKQYPEKKWIIDAGALQVIHPKELEQVKEVIITPHRKEFEKLFNIKITALNIKQTVQEMAKKTGAVIVLKGKEDIICAPNGRCVLNKTGNEGMTKGGTGDVLAGLIAALACKNDLFLSSVIGAYINGLAGDDLYKKTGPFYNADQLADRVPEILWRTLVKNRK